MGHERGCAPKWEIVGNFGNSRRIWPAFVRESSKNGEFRGKPSSIADLEIPIDGRPAMNARHAPKRENLGSFGKAVLDCEERRGTNGAAPGFSSPILYQERACTNGHAISSLHGLAPRNSVCAHRRPWNTPASFHDYTTRTIRWQYSSQKSCGPWSALVSAAHFGSPFVDRASTVGTVPDMDAPCLATPIEESGRINQQASGRRSAQRLCECRTPHPAFGRPLAGGEVICLVWRSQLALAEL
jgi:hypothetical protein